MAEPHPTINFRVNLTLLRNESIGPVTNSVDVGMLHPDRHQTDQDIAISSIANRPNAISTWLPGNLVGENRQLKHGDTFTLYGQKALYVRNTYAVGYAPADRAWLEVV